MLYHYVLLAPTNHLSEFEAAFRDLPLISGSKARTLVQEQEHEGRKARDYCRSSLSKNDFDFNS
jgi:hypothetical protein